MFDFNKAVELFHNEYSDDYTMKYLVREVIKFIADNNFVVPTSPHAIHLVSSYHFQKSDKEKIVEFFKKLGYIAHVEFLPAKLIIFLKEIQK